MKEQLKSFKMILNIEGVMNFFLQPIAMLLSRFTGVYIFDIDACKCSLGQPQGRDRYRYRFSIATCSQLILQLQSDEKEARIQYHREFTGMQLGEQMIANCFEESSAILLHDLVLLTFYYGPSSLLLSLEVFKTLQERLP